MKNSFRLGLALSLSAVAALGADSVALEEVSVVGSVAKGSGKIDFMQPGTTTAITQDKISEQGASQLDNAVKYEAGFINPYGTDLDTTDWLKLRGFNATVTLDGSTPYKGGYLGAQHDIYGLESIEVVKGANSLLYGASSAGGVINLVSKRPTAKPFAEVGFKIGNKNQRGIFFDASDELFTDRVKFRLVGNYEKKHGDVDFTHNEHYYIAPSLLFLLGDETTLTLLSSYTKDNGTGVTAFYPYPNVTKVSRGVNPSSNSDFLKREQYTAGYELTHNFTDNLKFASSYKFNKEDKEQLATLYVGSFGVTLVDADVKSHTFDNRLSYEFQGENIKNLATFGFDYRKIKADGIYGFSSTTPWTIGDRVSVARPSSAPRYDVDQSQLGFYFSNQATLFDNLILNAAVRRDKLKEDSDTLGTKNNYEISKTTYQAGVMYNFDAIGLMPFFNYSQSFTPVVGSNSAVGYKPIEGRQYETGVKYLPEFIDGEFSLAYFDIEEKNALVGGMVGGLYIQSQAGKKRTKGLEISSNVNLTDDINWIVAYTHYFSAKTHDGVNGDIVTQTALIPKNTLSSFITYKFSLTADQSLKVGAGVRYVSSIPDGSASGYKSPSYTLLDAMAEYEYKKLSVGLNVNNLTDKEYFSGCDGYYCYYGEGIRATLTAKYKF